MRLSNDIVTCTCTIAAIDPAITPAAPNPAPTKTKGTAAAATTPMPIAAYLYPTLAVLEVFSIHINGQKVNFLHKNNATTSCIYEMAASFLVFYCYINYFIFGLHNYI